MSYLALAKKAEEKLRNEVSGKAASTSHNNPSSSLKPVFQERASIREYDGNQPRVEAELSALDEVLPQLKKGELIIPLNSPARFRWWQDGQSIEATLRELGASEETIKRYVWDKTGGVPKREEHK